MQIHHKLIALKATRPLSLLLCHCSAPWDAASSTGKVSCALQRCWCFGIKAQQQSWGMFSASCCIISVQFVFQEGEGDVRGVWLALRKAWESTEKQGEFSLGDSTKWSDDNLCPNHSQPTLKEA